MASLGHSELSVSAMAEYLPLNVYGIRIWTYLFKKIHTEGSIGASFGIFL